MNIEKDPIDEIKAIQKQVAEQIAIEQFKLDSDRLKWLAEHLLFAHLCGWGEHKQYMLVWMNKGDPEVTIGASELSMFEALRSAIDSAMIIHKAKQ